MTIQLLHQTRLGGTHVLALQAKLYDYLLEQAEQGKKLSMRQLVEAMRCQSPLPILSRLKHLEEQGYLMVSQS